MGSNTSSHVEAEQQEIGVRGHMEESAGADKEGKIVVGGNAILVEMDADVSVISLSDDSSDDDESDCTEDESEEEDDEDEVDEEETALILADVRKLKAAAEAFLHPEKEVKPGLSTRCYFDRFSAPEVVDQYDAEERARIIADAEAMKKISADFMHPEVGVVTSDPCACGRNYFDRASAEEYESVEDAQYHSQVLADAVALKKLAVDYAHPEKEVKTDPAVFGRNYFERATAEETESAEEADYRSQVLADAAALKKLAVDYVHPEKEVKTDPAVFGRNYFSRASAEETESFEEAGYRSQVLADVAALKKLAVDYAHPENEIKANPAVFGRNYFDRVSAEETESAEEADYCSQVLADVAALKKLAVDYGHPEKEVKANPAVFGRNYFNRASAGETESSEEAEYRSQVLADAVALKNLVVNYTHPEVEVKTDPNSFGRNYFNRCSAPGHAEVYAYATASAVDLREEKSRGYSDHFEFEDDFSEMRSAFEEFNVPVKAAAIEDDYNDQIDLKEEAEGENLSRSPSSVMLFGLAS